MKKYRCFIVDFTSFDPKAGRIELQYSFDDEVYFTETIQLPKPVTRNSKLEALGAALEMLHMLGGVSYYKACCPEKIIVKSGNLSKEQAEFFQTVYENGLGEFAYKNTLNLWGKIRFPFSSNVQPNKPNKPTKPNKPKFLVPLGGGKDSIVTIERLRAEGKDITLFRMGRHPLIDVLVEAMDLPCITVERTIAPELLQLNKEGALNGHVPITAYLSALAVVVAELYGFDAIAMSNERSASEGNVEHFGKVINHQWSKSAEAEEMIRTYIQKYIDPDLRYENPLREMTELEIVGNAAKYPQYFEVFTSCNKNWRLASRSAADAMNDEVHLRQGYGGQPPLRGGWCGSCPKCAFAFLLFAAHLPKKDVLKIFGNNLFNEKSLLPLYRQLLGMEGFKPFECVGTPAECREALALIKKRGEFDDAVVVQFLP